MNSRNNYVNKVSNKLLLNMIKDYNLNIKEDPQLHELLRGISLLHASKSYEDECLIENAFKGIKYNLSEPFEIAPHGLINIQSAQTINLNKDFIFRSNDSIYKTIDNFSIHNIKLINVACIIQYDQHYLEIKLNGNMKGKLEFFGHMELVNEIFKENEKIKARGFNGIYYDCVKKIRGSFFENQNCLYLTSFFIDFIEFENQLTLYIPVNNKIKSLLNLEINCVIVANKFDVISIPCEGIISLPENTEPIQIKCLMNENNEIIPHKRENENGWHICESNDILFTNVEFLTTAKMVCKNIIPDVKFCQSEIFIPSTKCEWKIEPIAEDANIDFAFYINNNSIELFKYLCHKANLEYKNLNYKNTVLQKYYEDKWIYEKGTYIYIELITMNYIMLNVIENEIDQYNAVKINMGDINE